MQCGILDWILEQEKDINGKIDKVSTMAVAELIVLCLCKLLSFANFAKAISDVNSKGK